MATYKITLADGTNHKITAPDDMPQEEAVKQALQLIPTSGPQVTGFSEQRQKAPYLPGVINAAANSPIIGMGDEATGAVQSVLPYPLGPAGESIPDKYRMARDSAREQQKAFASDYPISDFAATVIPAVASGPGLLRSGSQIAQKVAPGLVSKIAGSPGGRYLAGVAGGTGGGLLGGYGYGEDAADTALGGAIGASIAAAVPPIASISGYVGNKAAQGIHAGIDLLRSPEKRFARKMAQAADRDQLTPQQIQQEMRDLGPEAMPIDVSPNIGTMGRLYAQSEGTAKAAATKSLTERAEGSQRRIVGDLFDATDVQDIDIDGAVQRLHENMREIGRGYSEILNTGIVEMDEGLEKLMGSRTMRKALGKAYSILDDDIALGRADKKLQMFFNETGDEEAMFNPMTGQFGEMAMRPTLRVWDYVKRGLDGVINDGTDPLTGKMSSQAERANALKRELLGKIDGKNPEYAQIRANYADEKAAEDAIAAGRRFMRDDAETTARKISDIEGGEKEFFMVGAARALRDKIMNRKEEFKQWNANPLEKEKIRAVMGKGRGDRFIKRMETESLYNASKNRTLAGSQTFETTQAAAEASQDPAGLLRMSGGPANWMLGLLQRDASKIPQDMINAGAEVLYNPQSLNQIPGMLNTPLAHTRGPFHISPERFYGGLLGASPQASGLIVR